MVLNNKDMRTIERAMGMILGSVDVDDEAKRKDTVMGALQMIDGTFEGAEKREEDEKKQFVDMLRKSCSPFPPFTRPEAETEKAEAAGEMGV